MNIRFEYLYRDGGNYKNWGDVVVSNKENLDVDEIERRAREVLIDSEFFVAERARVPDLHFPEPVEALDHDWHQLHCFVETEEAPTDKEGRDIKTLLECLMHASRGCA